MGNAFSLVALPLLVLTATGSVVQMGLLTATAAGAALLTGLVAGAVVDRVDRRRLLMVCDAARLVLHGSIPVCWAVTPQVGLLFVVAGLAAVFDQLFRIGQFAVVPALVGRSRIPEANGLLSTTTALALVGGPALAGVVSGLFGPTAAVGINAASFGVSLAGLALVRLPPDPVAPGTPRPTVLTGFVVGARFLWRHPVLRSLTAALTVTTFLTLGMTDLIIYRLRDELGQDQQVVGLVLALGGVGTCLAAATSARLRRGLGFGTCWLGAVGTAALGALLLGLSTGVTGAAAGVVGYSFGVAMAGITSLSLRQELTPDPLLGRVTAAFWTIHGSAAPLGATLLTAAAGRFGTGGPLIAVAAVFAVVAVVAAATPIRQRQSGSTEPGAATAPRWR